MNICQCQCLKENVVADKELCKYNGDDAKKKRKEKKTNLSNAVYYVIILPAEIYGIACEPEDAVS